MGMKIPDDEDHRCMNIRAGKILPTYPILMRKPYIPCYSRNSNYDACHTYMDTEPIPNSLREIVRVIEVLNIHPV